MATHSAVVDVKVQRSSPGLYDFHVTVKSVDKGWAHYADAFEVLAPDGTLLGRRVLLHLHENEQCAHGTSRSAAAEPRKSSRLP